jgi:aminopeptidase-like protein
MHDVVKDAGVEKSRVAETALDLSADDGGRAMYELVSELYPICRSITGEGVRRTLRKISRYIHLTICEVPSGCNVFDWTVPPEWNIRDAYIADASGNRVVDFQTSNLHVVGYSIPVRARMSLPQLKQHLHTDPEHPDWIPYRTSYYSPTWGFCLAHNQMLALHDGEYEVCIDSSLKPGHLTYGDLRLLGQTREEVLISCHVCHPSLCNDNLSGIAVATAVAQRLSGMNNRYSYRFLFIPGTIGSITWLAMNHQHLGRIKHGMVLTGIGDAGAPTFKRTRNGDADIDKAWQYVLEQSGRTFSIRPFSPYGYDERQFCSPGIDLPVGCFMRTPHGEYAEYHTSADDLRLVRASSLADSLAMVLDVIDVIERNQTYVNTQPYCEPRLGKYGLYRSVGGGSASDYQMALLWLLNMSDGRHTVLDIAARARLPWATIKDALDALCGAGLLALAAGQSVVRPSAPPECEPLVQQDA